MTPKPMTVAGITYPSKTAVLDRARQIKDSHSPGDRLEGDELPFILDLLQTYHPRGFEKIGCGAAGISITLSSYGDRQFCVERVDGTRESFSYRKCISQPTRWGEFCEAARRAIADQVAAYARQHFHGRCEYTGEAITRDQCHVDHVPPRLFVTLLREFLRSRPIDFMTIPLTRGDAGEEGVFIGDPTILRAWQEYHREHAVLRIVSRRANEELIPKESGEGVA